MMQPSRSKRRAEKGLSLPEILVACFISLVAIGAILSAFLSGRLASTGAKHWTQARNLAQARIEQLKSLDYNDLAALPATATETGLVLDDRGGGTGVQCTRTTGLTQEDNGMTIAVTISWNEKTAGSGSAPWTYDLKTWVAYPGRPAGP